MKDTIIRDGQASYRVHITYNLKKNCTFQIISEDSSVIVQDTTEYSDDLYLKEQDCNNDGFRDLLICSDKDCKFINLLYSKSNQHKPFVKLDVPADLKEDHFTMLPVGDHPDYFCFLNITLCTNNRGEIQGMHPLNNVILFRINRHFKIERILEIDHNDCKNITKADLYKYIRNKRTFIKTIDVSGIDPFPNVTYIKEHFEELIKK